MGPNAFTAYSPRIESEKSMAFRVPSLEHLNIDGGAMPDEKKPTGKQSQTKPDESQFREQHGEPMDDAQVSRSGETTKQNKKADEAA
jgi:hypothetical protein